MYCSVASSLLPNNPLRQAQGGNFICPKLHLWESAKPCANPGSVPFPPGRLSLGTSLAFLAPGKISSLPNENKTKLLSYLEGEHECLVPLIHMIPGLLQSSAASLPCLILGGSGGSFLLLGWTETRAGGREVFSDGAFSRPAGFQFLLGINKALGGVLVSRNGAEDKSNSCRRASLGAIGTNLGKPGRQPVFQTLHSSFIKKFHRKKKKKKQFHRG